LTKYYKMSI